MRREIASSAARQERAALADLFEAVGPDAPTLCSPWTAADLVAHLVARERRPLASVGLAVPRLGAVSERARLGVFRSHEWRELVATFRGGAPIWSGGPLGDAYVNLVEFFIHHEDVRRARPGWTPRPLPPELESALWRRLRVVGRLMARTASTGLTAQWGDQSVVLRDASPMVTVAGPPAELLLFCSGRARVARVDRTEPSDAGTVTRNRP
jgi:uncharacterized protein (TIGR03085 family)